jgi:hypothetical protein
VAIASGLGVARGVDVEAELVLLGAMIECRHTRFADGLGPCKQ